MADGANPDDEDVFVYTTGSIVPRDLVRVRVHPSVTVIPAEAFMSLHKLEEVELEGLLEIGENAFAYCHELKRIKIPSTVTIIGEMAFMFCSQLKEVELCEGLSEIGEHAFDYCRVLRRIKIPSSVTAISDKTFRGCSRLEEVELSDGLQTIGKGAFYECHVLKRIKIPSTVTIIDDLAFNHCGKLEEVELREGLHTIGQSAFDLCGSLKHISFPSTIRTIGNRAFADEKSLLAISLPNGIESIGSYALMHGRFFTFRIPPLITTIPQGMVEHAVSLFSLELSESVTHLRRYAFARCSSLRNLAISPNTSIENGYGWVFCQCKDLLQLFDSGGQITNALKHRFDNLPIHKMLYYQSYESVSLDQLNSVTNMRSGQRRAMRSKLDPTGKQQDCLGMTPLHILACSTIQNLELYKVLIEKYPENLITEDRWGALPLLYAVWGNTPNEIVQYLVERYHSKYPDYQLDWTRMLETLGLANVPKEAIQKLVDLQKESFPKQNIDWERLLESKIDTYRTWDETFGYLVQFSLAKRIDAIGLKQWRDDIKHTTENCDEDNLLQRQEFITEVTARLAHYETEYHNLKEATSILELALWKHKMNDHILMEKKRRRKKTKIEESSIREQCRISCGADILIEHMLPYLLPKPVVYTDKIQHNTTVDSSSESDDESDSDISYF